MMNAEIQEILVQFEAGLVNRKDAIRLLRDIVTQAVDALVVVCTTNHRR